MKLTPLTLALIPALLASQVQAAPTTLGKGEGQLNIVAWAGYVERGETDKNYATGSPASKKRPAARSTSRRPPPRTRWWR